MRTRVIASVAVSMCTFAAAIGQNQSSPEFPPLQLEPRPQSDAPLLAPPVGDSARPAQPPLAATDVEFSVDALLAQAEQLRQLGTVLDLARAIQVLDKVLQVDRTNLPANLMVAEISMQRNDYNNARDFYKRVLTIDGNNFRANMGMARYYFVSRIWRQATGYLQRAEGVAPPEEVAEVLTLLAQCYVQIGELTNALRAADAAVSKAPESYEAMRTMLAVQLQMGDLPRALEAANRVIDICRTDLSKYADRLDLAQRFAQSFDLKIEVLKALHNSMHRRNSRNEVTDQPLEGKQSEIANVLAQIVEARSRQLPVLQRLSMLEIAPMALKAVELEPNEVSYVILLARTLIDCGMYSDAYDGFVRALELDPNNEIAKSAIMQLEAQGVRSTAEEQMRQSPQPSQPEPGAPTPVPPPQFPPAQPSSQAPADGSAATSPLGNGGGTSAIPPPQFPSSRP